MAKITGLGQGVGLLFEKEEERFFDCSIAKITPNRLQPRTAFDDASLQDLAASIKEKGVIQPLIVKKSDDDPDGFELVAGERRLRASKIAGLSEVPVVLVDVESDDALLELALIENVQRTDLNPIEEALAYQKLISKFGYTQEQTAKRVGKQRATVANLLRLLKLPESIQQDVGAGLLSEGHARALLRLVDSPVRLNEARTIIIKNQLSVRQAEKLVKKYLGNADKPIRNPLAHIEDDQLPLDYRNSIVTQLTNRLNSKVAINQMGSRGKIEIEYYSHDDLDRLLTLLL